jgi:hypothetical protein
MFEQRGDVMLNLLQLVELQVGIDNGEQITSPGLLVNENAPPIANELFFDFQLALAFEHHRQDVTCGNEPRVIFFDKFAEKGLSSLALDGLDRSAWGLIDALPVGDEAFPVTNTVAVLRLPTPLAYVGTLELRFVIEQQRVIPLLVGESFTAGGAGVGARLDLPFRHGRRRISTCFTRQYYEINPPTATGKLYCLSWLIPGIEVDSRRGSLSHVFVESGDFGQIFNEFGGFPRDGWNVSCCYLTEK